MTYCFISIAGAPSPSWIKARQKSRSGPRHDSDRGGRTSKEFGRALAQHPDVEYAGVEEFRFHTCRLAGLLAKFEVSRVKIVCVKRPVGHSNYNVEC
jgi:hypothetical protein